MVDYVYTSSLLQVPVRDGESVVGPPNLYVLAHGIRVRIQNPPSSGRDYSTFYSRGIFGQSSSWGGMYLVRTGLQTVSGQSAQNPSAGSNVHGHTPKQKIKTISDNLQRRKRSLKEIYR